MHVNKLNIKTKYLTRIFISKRIPIRATRIDDHVRVWKQEVRNKVNKPINIQVKQEWAFMRTNVN